MLKKSIYSAIICLLILIFSLILQLIEKKSAMALLLGFVTIGFIIVGIDLDYKEKTYTIRMKYSHMPTKTIEVDARWHYFFSMICLLVAFADFYFFLNLNDLYDSIILISWILSIISLLVSVIFCTLATRLKIKSKRKKYKCSKCGAKLSPGYNICLQCGEKIPIEE